MINQFQTFLYSLMMGAILGVIYDVFRISRLIANFRQWGLFFQDILYFFMSGICTFLFCLAYNYGEIRFYIIAGEIIGWIAYYITLGEIVYRFSGTIIIFIKKIIGKLFEKVYRPLVSIFNKIKAKVSKIKIKRSRDVQDSNKT